MDNGRCFRGNRYESLKVINRSDEEECEYLIKCALSRSVETNCSCYQDFRCAEKVVRGCPGSLIRYPRGAVVTPFTFFLFNRRRDWSNERPGWLLINGTVRCRHGLVTVGEEIIPFDINWDGRRLIEENFCAPSVSKIRLSSMVSTRPTCHHENESTDLCNQ